MTELFKFILSDFWIFIGFCVIFNGIGVFILRMYNRTWRHYNIRKHGYPPPHCDADGDLRPIKKKSDEN